MEVYLDNAATKPITKGMKEYLKEIIDTYYGNPSSAYDAGYKSRDMIENTRADVARFINANSGNIIFTCGGSASNTLGIQGYIKAYKGEMPLLCYYLSITHKSIRMQFENGSYIKIPMYKDGTINSFLLGVELEKYKMYKPFVCIEYANSEIGTLQNVKEVANLVHKYNGVIYVDCTGSISSIPLDVKDLNIDILGFSGHKIGALKGVGVLYKKDNIELSPLIYGKQECGLFGGTENILGIASLGKAVRSYRYSDSAKNSRSYLLKKIYTFIPNVNIIGEMLHRLPNNLYLCINGVNSDTLVALLNEHNIQISTGSACNSGELTPPHVLTELDITEDTNSCIRISVSGEETIEQLDYFCDALRNAVKTLRGV